MSSVLTLYEKGFTPITVTILAIDAWTVGRRKNTIPCLFAVADRDKAFKFIEELSLFGSGRRTRALVNGQRFEVLFTDGHKVIPHEWHKLGMKSTNLSVVIVADGAIDKIPQVRP